MYPWLFTGKPDGSLFYDVPDVVEVIEASRDSLRRQTIPVPEWMTAQIDLHLAQAKSDYGEIEAASLLIAEADPWLSKLPESPVETFDRVRIKGDVAMQSGLHDVAEGFVLQTEAIRRSRFAGGHPYVAWDYIVRALNLLMSGRPEDAYDILMQAPRFDLAHDGSANPDIFNQLVREGRARIALDRGKPQVALALLPDGPEGDSERGVYPTALQIIRGEALCANGQIETGLRLLLVQDLRYGHTQHPKSPYLAYTRSQAGLCALKAGDKRLAAILAREARAAFVAQPKVSPYYKAPLKQLEEELGLHLPPV
jgi:tetratricopeptide (TPR) repeat protein